MRPAHGSLGKHQREGDLEFDQALATAGLLSREPRRGRSAPLLPGQICLLQYLGRLPGASVSRAVPIYLHPLHEDATGGSGALGEPSIQGGGRIGRERLVSAITLAGWRRSAIGRCKTIARSFDRAIVFAAPAPNGVQPPPTSPFVSSTKNSPFMCV